MPRKIIIAGVVFVVVITGVYLALAFGYLSSQGVAEHSDQGLPSTYTLKNYTVEKELGSGCKTDRDCVTPPEYMMISRCPMTAICINKKCAVVCPGHRP
jgi:hypothetical protein